jgi:hypothetical protein
VGQGCPDAQLLQLREGFEDSVEEERLADRKKEAAEAKCLTQRRGQFIILLY